MEAAILSSESPNGLFNSVAGGGNAPSEGGNALPFSQVLQSQQLNTVGTPQTLTPTTMQAQGSEAAPAGVLTLPPMMPSDASTVPWMGAAVRGQRELNTELSSTLESPTAVTWVDPALVTQDSQALAPTEPHSLALGVTVQSDQTSAGIDNSTGRQSVGGGGQAEQLVPLAGAEQSDEQLESNATFRTAATPLTQSTSDEPSVSTRVAPEQSATKQMTQPINSTVATAGTTAVAENTPETQAVVDGPDGSDLQSKSSLEPTTVRTEIVSNRPLQREEPTTVERGERPVVNTSETLSAESTDLDLATIRSGSASLSNAATGAPEGEVDLGLRTATGGEVKPTNVDALGTNASNKQVQPTAEAADRQRAIDTTQTQQAASAASAAPSQSGVAAVSSSDAMATQVRSAQAPQAKRADTAERVDSKVAVDGGEGYHWLDSGADAVSAEELDLPLNSRSQDQSSAAMANTTTVTPQTTAAKGDAAIESFASVRQSVDAAQATNVEGAETAELTSLEIDTPVRDAQWSQAFAYRVQFMAQQGIQRAQVQLNPAELGPMEITVDLADDAAQIQITAENATTLEAVEQAVPRLREMMAQSGFAETGVDLNDQREEPTTASADTNFSNANSAAGEDRGESRGERDQASAAPGRTIETQNVDQTPQRQPDGRLSFYV